MSTPPDPTGRRDDDPGAREQQLAERAGLGLTEPYEGLVFTTAAGAPLYGAEVLSGWYKALDRIGLPRVTFHDGAIPTTRL